MTFSIQSKQSLYAICRIIRFAVVAVSVVMPLAGCHSIVGTSVHRLNQTSIAQDRFNGASACDSMGVCAGYTETNWTQLTSCSYWDSSFEEVPIPYGLHEHASVRDESTSYSSTVLSPPDQRHTISSRVQQASYGVDDNTVNRDTGINDEVYEYAETCVDCEGSVELSNDEEPRLFVPLTPQSDAKAVNEKKLDDVMIEYLQ